MTLTVLVGDAGRDLTRMQEMIRQNPSARVVAYERPSQAVTSAEFTVPASIARVLQTKCPDTVRINVEPRETGEMRLHFAGADLSFLYPLFQVLELYETDSTDSDAILLDGMGVVHHRLGEIITLVIFDLVARGQDITTREYALVFWDFLWMWGVISTFPQSTSADYRDMLERFFPAYDNGDDETLVRYMHKHRPTVLYVGAEEDVNLWPLDVFAENEVQRLWGYVISEAPGDFVADFVSRHNRNRNDMNPSE